MEDKIIALALLLVAQCCIYFAAGYIHGRTKQMLADRWLEPELPGKE
jgi:hypothetical protein